MYYLIILYLFTSILATQAQDVVKEEIQLDRLLFIQEKFGSDSVKYWLDGTPIWLLDEKISVELATNPDSSSQLDYYVNSLGQNLDDQRLALKLDRLYKAWFKALMNTNISKELIPTQDDRLILALLNQSSLERQDYLKGELKRLCNIRDSIHAIQPNIFRKFLMAFKGFDKIVQNKHEIELAILKTFYQLNAIDSIEFPQSIIKKQTRKIQSWRRPYDPTRFSNKTKTYDTKTLELKADTITNVVIEEIRDIKSFLRPIDGLKSRVRKIIHENSMILVYGISDGQLGGWGEIILVKLNEFGQVEYEIIEQWM